MRPNPGHIEAAITELGVGEAWCPAGRQGAASAHRAAWIVPPASRIGPATDAERQALRRANPLSASEQAIDRESAYEVLAGRASASGQNGGGAGARHAGGGQAPAGEEAASCRA